MISGEKVHLKEHENSFLVGLNKALSGWKKN